MSIKYLLEEGKTIAKVGLMASALFLSFPTESQAQLRNAWIERIRELASGRIKYADRAVYEEKTNINMIVIGKGDREEMPKEEIEKLGRDKSIRKAPFDEDSMYLNKEIWWAIYRVSFAFVRGPAKRFNGPLFNDGLPELDDSPPNIYDAFNLMTVFVVLRVGFDEDPRIDVKLKEKYYKELYKDADKTPMEVGPIEAIGTAANVWMEYKIAYPDLSKVVDKNTLDRMRVDPPLAILSSSVDKYAPDLVDVYVVYSYGVLVLSVSDDTYAKIKLSTYPPDRFMTALSYANASARYYPIEISYFPFEKIKAFAFDSEHSVLLVANDKGELMCIRPERRRDVFGKEKDFNFYEGGYTSSGESVLSETYNIGKNLVNPKIKLTKKDKKEMVFELTDDNLTYPVIAKIKVPKQKPEIHDINENLKMYMLNDVIEPWEIIDRNKENK